MNGAASGLIEALATALPGTDWDQIPYGATSWYKYGSAGIGCWGTLCGVPNGCIAVLNLMNLHGNMEKVLGYYSETSFPTNKVPNLYEAGGWTLPSGVPEPIPDDEVLAHTVSESPLCHVSISKWCYAAGVDLNDTDAQSRGYKNDRCGKICADMAAHTAELINGTCTYEYVMDDDTADCVACHWKVSDPYTAEEHPAQCGKMVCDACHDMGRMHPGGCGGGGHH